MLWAQTPGITYQIAPSEIVEKWKKVAEMPSPFNPRVTVYFCKNIDVRAPIQKALLLVYGEAMIGFGYMDREDLHLFGYEPAQDDYVSINEMLPDSAIQFWKDQFEKVFSDGEKDTQDLPQKT